MSCNRGKRSIALDLKSESGRRTARALVGAADIILENFRPGTLERLIGDPLAIRSDLIVCSISGFGATGPRRDEPGYDVALQGMSGLMSITGIDGEAPIKVGVAWIDVITGLLASNAIQVAYIHRLRTGQGQRIDLSLWDACTDGARESSTEHARHRVGPDSHGARSSELGPLSGIRVL